MTDARHFRKKGRGKKGGDLVWKCGEGTSAGMLIMGDTSSKLGPHRGRKAEGQQRRLLERSGQVESPSRVL